MIRARFFKSGRGIGLSVHGHACYVERGADIVCAAVSGILYALIGYLVNIKGEPMIHSLNYGCADIECLADGEEAMKLACIGLLQVASSYSGYVTVDDSVWNLRIGDMLDCLTK